MDRRTFLAGTGAVLLAAPLAAGAQQAGKVFRIGLLYNKLPATPLGQGPFFERMRELGWVYGRDFVAERRAFDGQYEREPDLATELIRSGVDIFVVEGGLDASLVQKVTRTIPIVTTMAGDLVLSGVAVSVARPGGNVTGIQTVMPQLIGKHLSLLKDTIPHLSRAGVLLHGSGPPREGSVDAVTVGEAETAGKTLRIRLQIVGTSDANEFGKAFITFQAQRAQGVIILRDAFMGTHLKTLVDLALKHRLPTISEMSGLAAQGGLMSYGYNFADAVRAAAGIVDKIMRGANVSEIPVEQATTFRLVINLKTARAFGLTVPPSVLGRADEVIQ